MRTSRNLAARCYRDHQRRRGLRSAALIDGLGPAALIDGLGPAALIDGLGPAALIDGRGAAAVVDGLRPAGLGGGLGAVTGVSALSGSTHGDRPCGLGVLGAPAPCSARKGPRGSDDLDHSGRRQC
ncbi:hypothetical protein Acy02nite_61350 [Actinoplanes cyaneus]|uniref:Uncharacterized protein n=1 Tax=Actinoplanes cyaneus TaxID=52696 RepID=A0A919MA67_9ACTN|nr:hypothetical protein Acy02nite_61350 [Actinoplanes cyaneus]